MKSTKKYLTSNCAMTNKYNKQAFYFLWFCSTSFLVEGHCVWVCDYTCVVFHSTCGRCDSWPQILALPLSSYHFLSGMTRSWPQAREITVGCAAGAMNGQQFLRFKETTTLTFIFSGLSLKEQLTQNWDFTHLSFNSMQTNCPYLQEPVQARRLQRILWLSIWVTLCE